MFGFAPDDQSAEAVRHRRHRLCPFNNTTPSCTKDRSNDPLGVCSVHAEGRVSPVITCPIRFREGWRFASDAAEFFFDTDVRWTALTEVPLPDATGKRVGNIDLILAQHDADARLIRFGSVEIQSVYISGNIRDAFTEYLTDPATYLTDPTVGLSAARPDYLSSRKRLQPQLAAKGSILRAWGIKQVVVTDTAFFASLPPMPTVAPEHGDLLWLTYALDEPTTPAGSRTLALHGRHYTDYTDAMTAISKAPEPGSLSQFEQIVQRRLHAKLGITT